MKVVHGDQEIPNGTTVKVLRPNLWSGKNGLVESYRDGSYNIRVLALDSSSFLVGAKKEELEVL